MQDDDDLTESLKQVSCEGHDGDDVATDADEPRMRSQGLQLKGRCGARWHWVLSEKLKCMGFKPSKADSDCWIRERGDHHELNATPMNFGDVVERP